MPPVARRLVRVPARVRALAAHVQAPAPAQVAPDAAVPGAGQGRDPAPRSGLPRATEAINLSERINFRSDPVSDIRTPRLVNPRPAGPSGPDIARRGLLAATLAIAAAPLWAQEAGEGSEGGEGGEGGEAAAAEPAVALLTALLTALGLVEGHLRAGAGLYAEGRTEMAAGHMKHPGDEIYAGLTPMLEAAGAPGFADELAALAAAVEGGASPGEVEEAHGRVLAAIETARAAAKASPHEQAEAIEALLREAAEEYEVGVVGGMVAELHEYQDAWGFTQVAAAQAAAMAAVAPEASASMVAAIAQTDAIFPGLVPEGPVAGEAAVLLGAAARVELVAGSLE